jgi:ribonuclease HII
MAPERSIPKSNSIETPPTLDREASLWQQGYTLVAGIDEAGRGALAGPVVAGAVVVPSGATLNGIWAQVRDSKLLKPAQRTSMAEVIRHEAAAVGIGIVSAAEIDRIGIAPATRLAMMQAIEGLMPVPEFLLIDWVRLPQCTIAQNSFAKADRLSVSVAAASILAKVARDSLMIQLAQEYPQYQFAANKGYGAPVHLAALGEHGPSPIHRYSFAPIAKKMPLFDVMTCPPDNGSLESNLTGKALKAQHRRQSIDNG